MEVDELMLKFDFHLVHFLRTSSLTIHPTYNSLTSHVCFLLKLNATILIAGSVVVTDERDDG